MAATDAFYRSQKTLNIIFAVSSIVMLVTIVAMFMEDYNRDWKTEQRIFRDVEEEMTKRTLLANAPAEEKLAEIIAAERKLADTKKVLAGAKAEMEKKHGDLISTKLKTETRRATIKADLDSKSSFYNGARERGETEAAEKYANEVQELRTQLGVVTEEVEDLQRQYDSAAAEYDISSKEKDVKEAEGKHKLLLADFDRFAKMASQKKWRGWKEGLLSLPVIDGFASPLKIQQYTLDDLPIDYSFKYVTRFDRCTTCHLGLEKTGYDKETLRQLRDDPGQNKAIATGFKVVERILKFRDPDQVEKMRSALDRRKREAQSRGEDVSQIDAELAALPDPDSLSFLKLELPETDVLRPRQIDPERLTDSRVSQFCSHPRHDLFVDANSPHPAEKFGCTICHSGQGSATRFYEASHSPNDSAAMKRWQQGFQWKSNHYWDYKMLPARFTESSCLKCHHQVTDLIRDGVRDEAPKLVKGYNLVRELGCFGCHEIAGIKSNRQVGPDLRLEPDPPLEALAPADRLKETSNVLNPPGTMRKVGPNVYRLAEKTNVEWVRSWLKSPRGFRPDTRMPHFYLQPNNKPENLPDDQRKFPDSEIHAVAHYLMEKSRQHLADVDAYHSLKAKSNPNDSEKKKLSALENRYEIRTSSLPAGKLNLPEAKTSPDRGRTLFSEKGCIACHVHDATATDARTADGKLIPSIVGESNFGPNLSRLALKLGTQAGKPETAKQWLVSWLLNPSSHSPRTLMPNVQLKLDEANEIATWLLSQRATWTPEEVAPVEIESLQSMARLYLEKTMTRADAKRIPQSGFTAEQFDKLAQDADERELGVGAPDESRLKMYVGKKGIANMGCYACHNIPGFQTAKPIGTALNEWGKKDVERLAFEDAEAYVRNHFSIVELRDDPKDKSKPHEDWVRAAKSAIQTDKPPYEQFFADMLDHHHRTREGFLHLKLLQPRAYDYNRIRTWDERLRMPQFKFARVHRQKGESDEAFEARVAKEEAEGREAVMTFILGLVAEPVPAKYVYNPSPDRAAVVRGRQVLEKYNCAGCHIIRPGSLDLKTPDLSQLEDNGNVRKQEAPYKGDDYVLSEHIGWTGLPPKSTDRWRLSFVQPPLGPDADSDEPEPGKTNVWLMDALQYKYDGKIRNIPAGGNATEFDAKLVLDSHAQFGGTFTNLLAKYLRRKDRQNFGGSNISYAYTAGPPILVGEGEKVQPDWLYQFLLNPHLIRPLTLLRMPKFNMSPDEAMAIVNYFNAVDKHRNRGIGLTYPYVGVPQRDEGYMALKTAEYISRLKAEGKYEARKKDLAAFWKRQAQEKIKEAEDRAKQAAEALAKAPEAEKAAAQAAKDNADKALKELQANGAKTFERNWEEREAYLADASRLVMHGNLCLTCHQAGHEPPKEFKGPNLNDVWQRMRPDWTARWITNPNRFLHYVSVMPINFKPGASDNQDAFVGTSEQQINAVRDYLMAYPLIKDWPVLRARPVLGMTPMAPTPAPGGR